MIKLYSKVQSTSVRANLIKKKMKLLSIHFQRNI